VARARDQVENGSYGDAMRTLASLPSKGVPSALAVEAGLLETTASLVTRGEEAGKAACAKAVVAADYDPEVARDQSPKVRAACRAAAAEERKSRLSRSKVTLSDLDVRRPEVAWQPVRISATASQVPSWLRVVARVTSSALEGSFDLALAPSQEGPLKGTLDATWIRPKATIKIELVAQDRFGDLGPTGQSVTVVVPRAEALLSFGQVPSNATVSVDGSPVQLDGDGTTPVLPGKHKVSMELPSGAEASTSVEVERGSVSRLALSPSKGSGLTWPIVFGAGAVALGAVGGVFMLNAANRASEIEELSAKREPGTNLPATEYSEIQQRDDERKTFSLVGTGLLIGAGVSAAVAVTILLWPEGKAKTPAKTGMRVLPVVGPGSVGVVGTF